MWNDLEPYQSYRVDTISTLKITKGNNYAKNVGGVTVLISAPHLVMLYISTKFCEIILNSIKVIERTPFLYWKLQRGIIPQKMSVEWRLFISARRLVMLYICANFHEIILNGIKVIERTRFLYGKLQRGIIPQKNVGGATVVNLCMSSGHALYLCQVSCNNIKRYQSYRVSTISIRKITKGNNSAKNAGGATVVNLCTSSCFIFLPSFVKLSQTVSKL